MEKQDKISALTRGIDLSNKHNVFILCFSLLMFLWFIVAQCLEADGVYERIFVFDALAGALSIFLIWALAREIDPDHYLTANISAIALSIYIFMNGQIAGVDNTLLFTGLLFTRVLSRTSGEDLKAIDYVFLIIWFAWVGWMRSVALGMITILAIIIDAYFKKDRLKELAVGVIGAGIIAMKINILPLFIPQARFSGELLALLTVLVLFAGVSWLFREKVQSKDDGNWFYLSWERLFMSRLWLITFIFVVGIFGLGAPYTDAAFALMAIAFAFTYLYKKSLKV